MPLHDYLNSQQQLCVVGITIPILQFGKLRLREVKRLVHGNTAGKWQN